jgi:hypothetical protein
MASPRLESLRTALAAMPPGALVPRDWLLEQLSDPPPATSGPSSTPSPLVDLTIGELGRLFGKQPSTVRAWVERGDFPGAYKLHGKEWRVPVSAVNAFQDRQRGAKSKPRLSAWRSVKPANRASRSESGPDPVTKRSPRGNAEV